MTVDFNSLLQSLFYSTTLVAGNKMTATTNTSDIQEGILGNSSSSKTSSDYWNEHDSKIPFQSNISRNYTDNSDKEASMENLNSMYERSSNLHEEIRDNVTQQNEILRQIDALKDGVLGGDNSSELKNLEKQLSDLKDKYDEMYEERNNLICEMNKMVDDIAQKEGVDREIVLNRFPAGGIGGPTDGETVEKQSDGTYTIKAHSNVQDGEDVYYGSIHSNKYPVEE